MRLRTTFRLSLVFGLGVGLAGLLQGCGVDSAAAPPVPEKTAAPVETPSLNPGTWYDVVPGFRYQYEATPEDDPELWESFESFDQMDAVSQIDPELLPNLSTPELLETVLS